MNSTIKGIIKDCFCLIKMLISVIVFIGLFYYSYMQLSKVFTNNDVYNGSEFHSLPEDSMDIIVLGSSHAQYSYVPAYMYQETGLYSFVLGTACQPYEVSYEMLKETLKTQSPELVIMEIFTATPSSSVCEGDSCFITAAYQMTGDEKYNTFNMLSKEKAETYYNDFINNHNNWRNFENLDSFIPKEETKYYGNTFGYLHNQFNGTENFWYPLTYKDSNMSVNMKEKDEIALNSIKRLCDEKGIKLMLYMVPMDSITKEDQAFRYAVWKWADDNNVIYVDFVDQAEKIGYKMSVHTDGHHSYLNGASLITHKLADIVKQNYSFNSHTVNEEIEKKNIDYMKALATYLYPTEQNPMIYLDDLKGYQGIYMIRYVPGQNMSIDLVNKLLDLGLSDFNPNQSYFAICNEGKVLASGVDYAYTRINDVDYLVQADRVEQGSNLIRYTGNLNIIIFINGNDNYVAKNIQSIRPDWWNNNSGYWEYGYDMYYSKEE